MDLPQPHVVVRRSARRKRTVTAYRERDTIVVLIPQRMSKTSERIFVDDMVKKVLAREAKGAAPGGDAALAARAREIAARYLTPKGGQPPAADSVVWVSNQNRRWGSCTPSTGTIRLSHRIQPMPAWVVDYVLLHELAHLVEPTHSARFSALLNAYPRAQEARGFLQGYLAALGQPNGEDDVD